MKWRRIRAVARKEVLHVVRDKRSLALALAVPLLMLLLFGYALTLDVDRVPTLVYDQDRSPESRALIERFAGSRYFEILGEVNGYQIIEEKIDAGECLVALVIAEDYSRCLLSGRKANIQLLIDGSDSNTASIALGYAQGLLRAYEANLQVEARNRRLGRQLDSPVEARVRVLYNSRLESKNYIVPGLIAVILMIIAALLTSLTIAREWEMGTMEQLLSTPVRPAELVLGKMFAYFGVGIADMFMVLLAGVLLFDVPLRGSPLLVMVTGSIFLTGALFWGILLSAVARNQLMAYQMGVITSFLPAFLLSGFIYAIENMPPVVQAITHIVPARYFVRILKGIFLKGVGWEVLAVEIGLLTAYAALIFLAATRRLRQKVV